MCVYPDLAWMEEHALWVVKPPPHDWPSLILWPQQRRREVLWIGTATAEGSVERCIAPISPHEARKNFFHLHFSVVRLGCCSTVVLCTAMSLTSAFRVIRDITERKKSIPKARYGKTNPADSWWGVGEGSRTTKREQLTVSNCMHVLHSHQLSATTWVPLPPDCIAHAY